MGQVHTMTAAKGQEPGGQSLSRLRGQGRGDGEPACTEARGESLTRRSAPTSPRKRGEVIGLAAASHAFPASKVFQVPRFVPAARSRPGLCVSQRPRNIGRAQGRPGARRTRGRRAEEKHGEGTTGESGNIRPSLRDGVTVYAASRALGASVGAPGPHDFTVRKRLG